MPKAKSDQLTVRFECIQDCSNCCQLSSGFVFLTDEESMAIAEFLEAPAELFQKWFTKDADGHLALVDGPEEHCVFLEDGICMIYPVRPEQCRTYPFWPENIKTKAHWNLTKKMCPGIGKGRLFSSEEISQILNGKDLDSIR